MRVDGRVKVVVFFSCSVDVMLTSPAPLLPAAGERRVVTCDKANLRGRTGARPNQQR